MKKLQPIERYLADQRKKGFSIDAVHDSLMKAGYGEEEIALALKSYDQHRIIISLLIACMVLVLVAAVVFIRSAPVTRYIMDVKQPIQQPNQQIQQQMVCPTAQPSSAVSACIEMEPQLRSECLRESLLSLDASKPSPNDPGYMSYSQDIGLIAALLDDENICARLSGEQAVRCKGTVPYLRATVGKDISACDSLPDNPSYVRCYKESLRVTDQASFKRMVDHFGLILTPGKTVSSSECKNFSSKRLADICRDAAVMRLAIDSKSGDVCSGLSNKVYLDACKGYAVMPANPAMPVLQFPMLGGFSLQ